MKIYVVMMQTIGHWSSSPVVAFSDKEKAEKCLDECIEFRKNDKSHLESKADYPIVIGNYATGHIKEMELDPDAAV